MRELIIRVGLIMIGGSLGAVTRYSVSLLAVRLFGAGFAWGTLIVNTVGCFLIGLTFALADRTAITGPLPRLFFVTGFLGALTTFSTYGLETMNFWRDETALLALANFLSNNVLGLILVFVGMWVGGRLI